MAENARRLRAGRVVTRDDAPALAAAIREAVVSPIMPAERIKCRKELAGFVGPEAVALAHRKVYQQLLSGA